MATPGIPGEVPTDAERDDVLADVVAVLCAMHDRDEVGVLSVLAGITPQRMAQLAATACALVYELGPIAMTHDAWIEALRTWQPGQRLLGRD